MPKVKEHCLDVKNNIVCEYEAGKGVRKLSKQFHVSVSSLQFIIKKWKEQGNVTKKTKDWYSKENKSWCLLKISESSKEPLND